jgi:geranylgeranyl diphosphate synthase type I
VFAALGSRYFTELDATMRQIIDHSLQSADREAPEFGAMLRYPLGWIDEHNHPYTQPTGKRIRPLLLLLCAEAVGGDWRQALPAAAAVEFLHNFSLIHDDIEDDSATRHGRPTVWKLWGLSNALNAGDAMFALAYIALGHLTNADVAPATIIKVLQVFNRTNLELTRGQHLDMGFEKRSAVTTDEYLSMIRGKSAALVAACAQTGALIGRNDEQLASSFADFGLNLGIAFQIRDDILGIWGDPAVTGKSAATDILSHKKSLPVLFGLQHSDELTAIFHRPSLSQEDVHDSVKLLDATGALVFARDTEERYYRAALAALEQTHLHSEAAEGLSALAKTLFERSA